MGMRLYLLPSGDRDKTKGWYPLGLSMKMMINFFYGNENGIAKPVSVPLCCHPYLRWVERVNE